MNRVVNQRRNRPDLRVGVGATEGATLAVPVPVGGMVDWTCSGVGGVFGMFLIASGEPRPAVGGGETAGVVFAKSGVFGGAGMSVLPSLSEPGSTV